MKKKGSHHPQATLPGEIKTTKPPLQKKISFFYSNSFLKEAALEIAYLHRPMGDLIQSPPFYFFFAFCRCLLAAVFRTVVPVVLAKH